MYQIRVSIQYQGSGEVFYTNYQGGDMAYVVAASDVSRRRTEPGQTLQTSQISITLLDYGEEFTSRLRAGSPDRNIKGAPLTVYSRSGDVLFAGEITSYRLDRRKRIEITAENQNALLSQVLTHYIEDTDCPGAGINIGTSIPIPMGRFYYEFGALKALHICSYEDDGITYQRYVAADRRYLAQYSPGVFYVWVEIDGIRTQIEGAIVNEADDRAYIDIASETQYQYLFYNAQAMFLDADPYGLIEDPVEFWKFILELAGLEPDEESTEALDEVLHSRGIVAAYVIYDGKPVYQVLDEFSQSFGFYWFQLKNGKIGVSISEFQLSGCELYVGRGEIIDQELFTDYTRAAEKVKYFFQFRQTADGVQFERSPVFGTGNGIEGVTLWAIQDETSALASAQYILFDIRDGRSFLSFRIPISTANEIDLGALICVDSGAALVDGFLLYLVTGITYSFENSTAILECENLSRISKSIFILATDDAASNWDDATDEERELYGYLTYDDGDPVPPGFVEKIIY